MVTDPELKEPVVFNTYDAEKSMVYSINLSDAFKAILEALDNVKVTQLKRLSDAKKITKLKSKITNLEIDIKDIIGE